MIHAEGEKTKYATLEEEYRALRLEVAELRMERDMLKKRRPTLRRIKNKAIGQIRFYRSAPRICSSEVSRMIRISMSGYDSYIRSKETKNKTEKKYREKIREIFNEGRGTYRVDRVC